MTDKEKLAIAMACLTQIANDWIELSHEKVFLQRNDYVRWAKKALEDIHSPSSLKI